MKSTRKNALAILLALLMTASALAGCSGTDDDVDDEPSDLEDWDVFLVQGWKGKNYSGVYFRVTVGSICVRNL